MTKPGRTREKVVVSSAPVAARLRKPRAVSGAFAGSISMVIAPCSVSIVTHWPVIFSIEAPSKGSAFGCPDSAGRAFAFLGVSEFGRGFWATAQELTVTRETATAPQSGAMFIARERFIRADS